MVGFLEDPLYPYDIEGWRLIRSKTMLPEFIHVPQSDGSPEIQCDCADVYMIGEMGIGKSILRGLAAAGLSKLIQITCGKLSKALAMLKSTVAPKVSHSTNPEDITGGHLEISDSGAGALRPGIDVDK